MHGVDLATFFNLQGTPFAFLPRFAVALSIGLLIGVERERKRHALAGIRTFPLAALFGCLTGMLAEQTGAPLLPPIGLLTIAAFGFLPHSHIPNEGDPAAPVSEPHTTTLIALLVTYSLGLLIWHGGSSLAVALGVATAALLYLKPELTGLLQKLARHDFLSLLQFVALSFIVLPILPNRSFGPYHAFNPYIVWLMVVLIVGVSLSGYLLVRLLGERASGPLLGILGGLASSTATSLVYSREVRTNPASAPFAKLVILFANLILFARLIVLALLVVPGAARPIALMMLPGLVIGLLTMLPRWAHQRHANAEQPAMALSNPTELKLAFGFATIFALVMFCAAWLNTEFGNKGVYAVALISGLYELDAISLTVLNLFSDQRIGAAAMLTALALAVMANTALKLGVILTIGGVPLARQCLPTLAASLLGMGIGGWLALQTL
ncbi:MgtC/SapB family protein [Crenobacter sp. SG2305]|uniref:MgtC/SapB family protein n=1 Tax=Crenobacter oryzisoli TaxID=3056844 RepID=UPI0025AAAD4B|nr:MgtC/SapB family protein [Crenobacter sp. SG2305]MDN0085301.1 MgtC/SapB family protein [Crenobacter sp. SG2305]